MTKEALTLALEALEKYARDFGSSDLSVKAMYVARQALAQPAVAEQHKQEPVAWCVINNGEIIGEPTLYLDGAEEILAGQIEGCGSEIAPLYTTPYVATPRPQRKPLTNEQIFVIKHNWIITPFVNHLDFARAIEAAHGIKE